MADKPTLDDRLEALIHTFGMMANAIAHSAAKTIPRQPNNSEHPCPGSTSLNPHQASFASRPPGTVETSPLPSLSAGAKEEE